MTNRCFSVIIEAGHDAARSEGFQRLDLAETLPGVAPYRAVGLHGVERLVVTMPDGVTLDAVAMECPIDHLRANGGHAPELP